MERIANGDGNAGQEGSVAPSVPLHSSAAEAHGVVCMEGDTSGYE